MKSRAAVLVLIALTTVCLRAGIDLPPNRGTQLILVMAAEDKVWYATAIDAPNKWIMQRWSQYDPTYDFVLAVSTPSDAGCNVSFIHYVMKDDYVPREERFEGAFPYSHQAHYPFFGYGEVIGFYRNSWEDFDHRKLVFPKSSNQSLQPTAGRSDV